MARECDCIPGDFQIFDNLAQKTACQRQDCKNQLQH